MTFKIVSMFLRSFTLTLMVLGFFFASECPELARLDHFVILGVCGGLSVVNLGLLLEAGLQIDSDKYLEGVFLVGGILLNLINISLSFQEYYWAKGFGKNQTMNIAMLSMLCVIFYTVDIVLLMLK